MEWKKQIMELSKWKNPGTAKSPIMRYPWSCNNYDDDGHIHPEGEICHCDDGYLCKHRAKWLINYMEKIIERKKRNKVFDLHYAAHVRCNCILCNEVDKDER